MRIWFYSIKFAEITLNIIRDIFTTEDTGQNSDGPPFDFHGYWLYIGDQAVLHLVDDAAAPRVGDARAGTFDHVAFACRDMPAFERHLQALGVPYRRSVVPGRGQAQIFVCDPAGNGVELNFDLGGASGRAD